MFKHKEHPIIYDTKWGKYMFNISQGKCHNIFSSKASPVKQLLFRGHCGMSIALKEYQAKPDRFLGALPESRSFMGALCFIFLLILAGTFTACGQESDSNSDILTESTEEGNSVSISQDGQSIDAPGADGDGTAALSSLETSSPQSTAPEKLPSENNVAVNEKTDEMKSKFGDNCIADQTFEVELSEYDGKVYFVPFAPSRENPDFHIQLIQDGKILAEIPQYIPEHLANEAFASLDAVSFFDINYDGTTDILLIETYGTTSFAAVYYGYEYESEKRFFPWETLSENLTRQVQPLTVSEIRNVLSSGKKNGNFSSYQEAYQAVVQWCTMNDSNAPELEFNLIHFDDDEIPELVTGVNGYYMSLYTFHDGTVYGLMDDWGYGVMGNFGYEYAPRKNSLRNYNSDYAGAIMHTTYMAMNSQHSLETTAYIITFNFDDVNGNGDLDEEEYDSVGNYSVSYLNGEEITDEVWDTYDAGEYEYIATTMSLEELMMQLG